MQEYIIEKNTGKKRKAIRKQCMFCNNSFLVRENRIDITRYCSLLCSSKGYSQTNRSLTTCKYCGLSFSLPKSRLKEVNFCSRTCKDNGQKIESGISEIWPDHYNDGKNTYRTKAFENYPHHCNRCSYDEVKEILVVHHKDRNRTNNKIENLEILCPNCHNVEHFRNKDGMWLQNKRGQATGSGLPLHGR